MLDKGMPSTEAYGLLTEIIDAAPQRLSGSKGAARAVEVATGMMHRLGLAHVRLEHIMVPHWERGGRETAFARYGNKRRPLAICALGGSVATPARGITAQVVEVRSFEELHALGNAVKGKIIFFNRPMDATCVNTFEAYGGAVGQRAAGAVEAAKAGGVAALVRSVTTRHDNHPHTGVMVYQDGVQKVPAAAVGFIDADALSLLLKRNPALTVTMNLSCATFPDAPSANVMGEIPGTEKPEEIVLVGGHLDCWDKGHGAHDDGAGCAQAMEALRLLNACGVKPKRTIRAVLFMNEENGNRGGKGYVVAPERKGERHIAVIESDRGGFAPLGFEVDGDSTLLGKVTPWAPLFAPLGAGTFQKGDGGVDITPMVKTGVPGFGLNVECQRYFDYHHSANDTLGAVNSRELELGAITEALLCYLLSEQGL